MSSTEELVDQLQHLEKTAFRTEQFRKFTDQMLRIYLNKESPAIQTPPSVLYLHRVPCVLEPFELLTCLLNSHHLTPALLFVPLGLIEIEVISNENDESTLSLTFVDEESADRFESRWVQISIASCFRSSVVPSSSVHLIEELEGRLHHVSLSRDRST